MSVVHPSSVDSTRAPREVSAGARPRVLMVAARYPPFLGGLETHTREVARRLPALGIDATVLTTVTDPDAVGDAMIDGVRVRRVRARWADQDAYLAPAIVPTIAAGRWDVVHCQGYHTLLPPLAMLAALAAGRPYVLTFHSGGHSSALRNLIRPVQWRLLRPLLGRAARLVAVSQFEADLFRRRLALPAERFAVIPNGAQLPAPATPDPIPREHRLIVSVGRLERYKGHHRLIEAMPRVLREVPTARLRIVGSGPYEPELRRMVERRGLADAVEIGAIEPSQRAAMSALLTQADLVALLSAYESQGIAVLEALALARPVLVADTSALAELVRGGQARGVGAQASPAEVAAAIVEQLRDPLVPSPIRLPTWDACAAALVELYHEITTRRPTCAS